MGNEKAVMAYVAKMAEIAATLEALQNWTEDHGGVSPDDVKWENVADANEVLRILNQAAMFIGVVPEEA